MNEPPRRERVSVVILTKNEEQLLASCLREVGWADEVLVVDSESTDATREIASANGAKVLVQPWLGWAQQRNAGAAAASHDWVLFLDADEFVTASLASAVLAVLASDPGPRDAFAVDRRDEFWGELLPQTQRRSHMLDRVRLYHRGHSSWDESALVHEEVQVPGDKHLLDGALLHWRPQSLQETATRIGRYSGLEIDALALQGRRASVPRLLLMPLARFLWLYVAKRCYRNGTAGFVNSVNRAYADFLSYAGLFEYERAAVPARPSRSMIDV